MSEPNPSESSNPRMTETKTPLVKLLGAEEGYWRVHRAMEGLSPTAPGCSKYLQDIVDYHTGQLEALTAMLKMAESGMPRDGLFFLSEDNAKAIGGLIHQRAQEERDEHERTNEEPTG